jgi:hypothetical protein
MTRNVRIIEFSSLVELHGSVLVLVLVVFLVLPLTPSTLLILKLIKHLNKS